MISTRKARLSKETSKVLFDLETNGFVRQTTDVWCMTVVDLHTGDQELFSDHDPTCRSLKAGLKIISESEVWAGHNLILFDVQIVRKLFPWVRVPDKIIDTLLLSRLLFPEIGLSSVSQKLPTKLKWRHSLEAWGVRLGEEKGKYDDFSKYTSEMGGYCVQDGTTNYKLLNYLRGQCDKREVVWDFDDITQCVALEHEFAKHVADQIRTGFYFDEKSALKLSSELVGKKEQIGSQMSEVFEPIMRHKELKTKCNIWWEEFNPASRKQIAERLMSLGWEPEEFTKGGQPKVDESTLMSIDHPEAQLIAEYLTIDKRLGALSNGNNAWLKLAEEGVIYGEMNTIGAVTGRVSHLHPNLSQVPAIHKPYGKECRRLFGPKPGWVQVGADLSGIELRCLAHYLFPWDDGEYAEIILNGDIHTANQEAAGLPTRNNAKTFIYGWLYGAGAAKLGLITKPTADKAEQTREGKKLKKQFQKKYPAFKHLSKAVKQRMERNRNYITGLDGRPLLCRSSHSSLNTLLQSAGAIVAKLSYVLFHREAKARGYVYGVDFTTLGFFHDEIQLSCRPVLAEEFGLLMVECMGFAGDRLEMRIQIDGEYKQGGNWEECH